MRMTGFCLYVVGLKGCRSVRERGFMRLRLVVCDAILEGSFTFINTRTPGAAPKPRAIGKVEPGTFDLWVAPSAQADGVHGTFDLTQA